MVRTIYLDLPVHIWPRNSYVLNTLKCALSDLDLTFYAYRPCNIYSQLWRYKFLKFFLPFLGEINFYQEEKLKKFLPYANYFELKRDPKLLEKVGEQPTDRSDYEKLVFFLKLLESDRKNLVKIPKYRENKWNLHFNHLNWELPPVNMDEMKRFLAQKLTEKEIKSKVFLKIFFDLDSKTKTGLNSIYEECSRQGVIKEYMLSYPFYWIGSAFYHDSFEHDLELLKNLTENESRLLLEQVRWELWGLFTQLEVTPDKPNLLMHLDNIRKLIGNIAHTDLLKESLNSVDALSEIVDSSLKHYKA